MANTTSDDGNTTDEGELAEVIQLPRTGAERSMGRWARRAQRAVRATNAQPTDSPA
jgi:hypothetical protein